MRAWAWRERTMAAWWTLPTGGWSSMNVPRPVRRRKSSTRLTDLPIQRSLMAGVALYAGRNCPVKPTGTRLTSLRRGPMLPASCTGHRESSSTHRVRKEGSPMRLRTLALLLVLMLLVGPLAVGIASSETKVGSNIDVRTIVAVKIAEAEAQKLLPPGWQVNPVASGPNQGATLTMTFIDQLLNQDPEGKPAAAASTRTLV